MKNLTKIFMAVVAGMFAFSCVTDTTEDLGIKIDGQGGVTELSVSLEASRTHLGDKVVNEEGVSLYPLYWSEGDAIAVNGQASNPLTGVASKATSATFTFEGEGVTFPLNIVTPAPEVAPEEGATVYPVVMFLRVLMAQMLILMVM